MSKIQNVDWHSLCQSLSRGALGGTLFGLIYAAIRSDRMWMSDTAFATSRWAAGTSFLIGTTSSILVLCKLAPLLPPTKWQQMIDRLDQNEEINEKELGELVTKESSPLLKQTSTLIGAGIFFWLATRVANLLFSSDPFKSGAAAFLFGSTLVEMGVLARPAAGRLEFQNSIPDTPEWETLKDVLSAQDN